MRISFFAVLVVVPVALIGWMVWVGHRPPPPERIVAARPAPPSEAEGDAALKALLREPLGGCKLKGEPTLYDAQGLFNYIDGAAPMYLERKFRKLAAAELATAEGNELTCDVYDMATPSGAESIFQKERSPTAQPAPDFERGVKGPMAFVFQEGRYYVKLTAFDAKAEAALPVVARAIAGKIR